LNDLRSRVVLQTDGKLLTGRDIAIATLLGAEEWGISTAALLVEGCIMMRKCHLNTCPVGIATQKKELRDEFNADPQWVVNFFTFLVEDLREIMASLGFKTIDEMVGRTDKLKVRDNIEHWKIKDLDLSPILVSPDVPAEVGKYKQKDQQFGLENSLDITLIEKAKAALEKTEPVKEHFEIENIKRTVGATLSHEVSKRFGSKGLPPKTIDFSFRGSAGQSFGAFLAPGITFELEGESNDYVGKGLSGGEIIVYPDKESDFIPEENIIIGNVAFYGATSGEAFIRGQAGERFCVRNSGARVVVEGVGDHGCEYMTGGVAVILGNTGKNFAAGMSGGIAYVYDPEKVFPKKCNMAMVDFDDMDNDDMEELHELLKHHFEYTGSTVAETILEQWPASIVHFVKVMPRDYKKVLEEKKKNKTTIKKVQYGKA